MKSESLTRRDLLFKCAGLGSLTVIPSLSLSEAAWAWQQHDQNARKPTAWDEIGPFYKRDAPQTSQLQRRGDPGLPVRVAGQVFDSRGDVLSGAKMGAFGSAGRSARGTTRRFGCGGPNGLDEAG